MMILLCILFFQIAVVMGFYNMHRIKKNGFYGFIAIFFLVGVITGLNTFLKNELNDKIVLGACLTTFYLLTIYVIKKIVVSINKMNNNT